jgi:hypothetical protein
MSISDFLEPAHPAVRKVLEAASEMCIAGQAKVSTLDFIQSECVSSGRWGFTVDPPGADASAVFIADYNEKENVVEFSVSSHGAEGMKALEWAKEISREMSNSH